MLMIRPGFLSAADRIRLVCPSARRPRYCPSRKCRLLHDNGESCAWIAKFLYLDDQTTRGWYESYLNDGRDALAFDGWKGGQSRMSQAQEAGLCAWREERLRLTFDCCYPAPEPKLRVALTLRTFCGLTTPEAARAFLEAEPTMGQRLNRARATITSAGIPFAVLAPELPPTRLEAVPASVYLVFTTGHVIGPDEPRNLCLEAEYLMRLIDRLRRYDTEIEGAVAMLLLAAARPAARTGETGASLLPGDQNRSLWDAARCRPGPFQIKAAIAECQMAKPTPDLPQISGRGYSADCLPVRGAVHKAHMRDGW